MRQSSNKSKVTFLLPILLALLIAKATWVALEIYILPKSGIDQERQSSLKALYYHYSLASKKELPKIIIKHKKPSVVIAKPKPEKFTKFILRGLYKSKEKNVIIVEYLAKSYALVLNEEIEGYKFKKLYFTYAVFNKNGEEYMLYLHKKDKNYKDKKQSKSVTVSKSVISKKEPKNKGIQNVGDTTYISKNILNKYQNNLQSIYRDIGIVPNTINGKLNGFKINFIKRGSDFDKLGVKKGDIITEVNGEALNNFKVPLQFFNNIDSIKSLAITVKRENEIKELEYEIR